MPILDDFAAKAPSKGTVIHDALLSAISMGAGALVSSWGYPWGALAFGFLSGCLAIGALTQERHRALAKALAEEKAAQP